MTSAVLNTGLSSITSDSRPSIFVLLAADSLRRTLEPAFSRGVRVLVERFPAQLGGRVYAFRDEIYLAVDYVLQLYHLRDHRALFSEHFYGLERTKVANTLSLAFEVIVPYVKRKLDRLFEEIRDEEETSDLKGIKKAFVGLYPYLHCLQQLAFFGYAFAYTIGKSKHHSPRTKLAGVVLKPAEDHDEDQSGDSSYVGAIAKRMATAISVGLEFSAFFLQFLDWWYSSDNRQRTPLTSLPIPDEAPNFQDDDKLKMNICPICRDKIKNATLLSTSGYVFCYVCIVEHLRTEGQSKCPVTGCPTSEKALIKIYD